MDTPATYPETTCIECMEHVTDAPVCPHCYAGTCATCRPDHYCYVMRERDEKAPAPAPWTEKRDEPADYPPPLEGRVAHCANGCGTELPSATRLAFFEYRGPGTRHDYGEKDHDSFYCGCKGFD